MLVPTHSELTVDDVFRMADKHLGKIRNCPCCNQPCCNKINEGDVKDATKDF